MFINSISHCSRSRTGDGFPGCLTARLSLQPKSRISLASDDSTLEYRRKSAGSSQTVGSGASTALAGCTMNNNNAVYNNQNLNASHLAEPYIYAFDEVERHADGTVVLR